VAIKRIGAAQPPEEEPTPGKKIKRVQKAEQSSGGEYVTKDELKDALAVYTLRDFNRAYAGQYGPTEKAEVDVVVVETGAKHEGMWVFGNLALQFGEGLEPGEIGLGKIVSGPTKSGNGSWWGIEWSDSDSEFELAENALAGTEEPPY